jgi:hypothetical protein
MRALMAATLFVAQICATPAVAQSNPSSVAQTYSPDELISAGYRFFGEGSRDLARIVEKAVTEWGLPNGYILGDEAGIAMLAGLRQGKGILYTKNVGDLEVYWQGPSIGFDLGFDSAQTMMLVYNLPSIRAIYGRFGGIGGSAYFVGGFGMTALAANDIVIVPIRTGLGLRLGANIGYLKFMPQGSANPF